MQYQKKKFRTHLCALADNKVHFCVPRINVGVHVCVPHISVGVHVCVPHISMS